MNYQNFISNNDVKDFIFWFERKVDSLIVDLDISRSSRVPQKVFAKFYGLNSIVNSYSWKSSWTDPFTNLQNKSLDWSSTTESLTFLKKRFSEALASNDELNVYKLCCAVLEWGGERNPSAGARDFLLNKLNENSLISYLLSVREALDLDKADISNLFAVEKCNSMLTKIYSIVDGGGLPIYDSRVAISAAGLVEIFRLQTQAKWKSVPSVLSFPVLPDPSPTSRRSISSLYEKNLPPHPAIIHYGMANHAKIWASSKIRLGWLIKEILQRNTTLFSKEMGSRSHAFEATLFMIGYDIRSLKSNLN